MSDFSQYIKTHDKPQFPPPIPKKGKITIRNHKFCMKLTKSVVISFCWSMRSKLVTVWKDK